VIVVFFWTGFFDLTIGDGEEAGDFDGVGFAV
jgi:hypothetical protein